MEGKARTRTYNELSLTWLTTPNQNIHREIHRSLEKKIWKSMEKELGNLIKNGYFYYTDSLDSRSFLENLVLEKTILSNWTVIFDERKNLMIL